MSSASDLLCEVGSPGTATTLSAPGYTAGDTSITVGSTANWPTATGTVFAIDRAEVVDGVEVQIAGSYNEFEGTVATGTSITNVDWKDGAGDTDYTAGTLTRVYVAVTAERENRIVTWGTQEHNQDGTHSDITADSITTDSLTITGSGDAEGWSALGSTLTFESNDGNKQATYSIPGVDKTDTIQEGMKVKLPRVTTVGTQCADFEASSSQYASLASASVSGCTFTDDFTCGAWVKVESNPNASNYILSRLTGGSGFTFNTQADGTARILGGQSSNLDYYVSNQTLPLGEWVFVVGIMNMSASTGGMYINGAVASGTYTNGSATAITQAGDLVLGGATGGGSHFDGKIKHAFVANKILSEAEVKEAMVSDDLETSTFSANLVGYYKTNELYDTDKFEDFSGNANHLTIQNSPTIVTDSPFSNNEYGIITSATFSTDTTLTVFTGSGVPVNENVTAPAYSTHRVPYGFPASKKNWEILAVRPNSGDTISSGATLLKTSLPIGSWDIYYNMCLTITGNVSNSTRSGCIVEVGGTEIDNTSSGFNVQATTGGTGNSLVANLTNSSEIEQTSMADIEVVNNLHSGGQIFYVNEDVFGQNIIRIRSNYL